MRFAKIVGILALILGLAIPAIHAAQSRPVEFSADVIEYDATTGLMTGRGSVQLMQDGAVLTGGDATYNVKTKEALVTGGVKMVKEDAVLTAAEVRSYQDNQVIARGDVELVKGDSVLTGPQIDYYIDKDYAVINNNARAKLPDGTMTADKLEAFLAENRLTGTGNVHIVSQTRQLDARADLINYYGSTEGVPAKAVLTGNARAVQAGNILSGNKLTIHLDDKAAPVQGKAPLVIKPQ